MVTPLLDAAGGWRWVKMDGWGAFDLDGFGVAVEENGGEAELLR